MCKQCISTDIEVTWDDHERSWTAVCHACGAVTSANSAYAAYMTGARLNSPASLIKSVVVSLVQLAVAGGVAIAAASKAKVVLAAAAPKAVVAAAAILGAAFIVKKEMAAQTADAF